MVLKKYRNDCYPFGSSINTRSFSAGSGFRFGFNTQEKDKEIYNNNETYTATFWEYDGRLGRRWNLDPKPNLSLSLYSAFANNPIYYCDPFGDTLKVSGSKNFIKNTNKAISELIKTQEGQRIYDKLNSSKNIYTIRESENIFTKVKDGNDVPVDWNSGDIGFTLSNTGLDMGKHNWIALAHELSHTEDVEDGKSTDDIWQTPDKFFNSDIFGINKFNKYYIVQENGNKTLIPPLPLDEVRAMDRENIIRAQYGYNLRYYYSKAEYSKLNVITGDLVMDNIFIQQVATEEGIGTHPNYNTNYKKIRKQNSKN